MPTATAIVWETYPQCPINNTLVVRDALTTLTNVSYLFLPLSIICISFDLTSNSTHPYNPTNYS
jgi:hypothetical protein